MTGFSSLLKILIIILFFSFGCTSTIFADRNIRENASLEYVLHQNDKFDFTYDIDLTVTEGYATAIANYNIEFPFENISFSSVRAGREILDFRTKEEEKTTLLKIDLNERILNQNNPISIQIEGEIEDPLLQRTTTNKALFLPSEISGINTTDLSLTYPNEYGKPHTTISNWNIEQKSEYIELTTSRIPKNINLFWGEIPIYNFKLQKKLVNSPTEPMKSFDITVPKALYNQKIVIDEISPLPHFAYRDAEGNIFFTYQIQPNTEVDIEIKGQIQLIINQHSDKITAFETSILTQTEGYWELTDEYELNRFKVKLKQKGVNSDKINQMSDDEAKVFYQFAYDYVVERLKMQNLKTNSMESNIRQGADNALKQRNYAVPEDYVDLLSAIYRTYGVPTRMVEGYVLQKTGFYHSWMQYWDREIGWVTIDPALESYMNIDYFNANLQNHITILTRSYNYLNPRVTLFAEDDFSIEMANHLIDESLSVENKVNLNPIKKTAKETTGIIDIKNTGNTIISLGDFANQEKIQFGIYNNLQLIVPNQTVSLPFIYDTSSRSEEEIAIEYVSVNNKELLSPLRVTEVETTFWWWDLLVKVATFIVIWIIIYVGYLICKKILRWRENYYQ